MKRRNDGLVHRAIAEGTSSLREMFQVSRPAMGLVAVALYLYDNPDPSPVLAVYFAFVYTLACNAGNDYMDWDRDRADLHREFSVSRGRASSKTRLWWYYAASTAVALGLGISDPLFGAQYLLFTEVMGQWLYNGIFLGVPINRLSLTKRVGFPLDVVVAAWSHMPFPYLVSHRCWMPSWHIAAWGLTMLWAQAKDYEHDKKMGVRTSATLLGPTGVRVVIVLAAAVMVYGDPRFAPYGVYTAVRCLTRWKRGKMSVVMALNLIAIVVAESFSRIRTF
jgi:4-hydroxybenzoate polyprenyltransferase